VSKGVGRNLIRVSRNAAFFACASTADFAPFLVGVA
jgi:hypothetical protein